MNATDFNTNAPDRQTSREAQRPARPRPVRAKPPVSADDVIKAFNTWAFKREQPDNIDGMRAAIARAIAAGEPISFVLYWGKGPRADFAEPDAQCLRFLNSLADRVRAVHQPGARFTLICTDTHAKLNGHSPAAMTSYFSGVHDAAKPLGFDTVFLGDLVAAAGEQVEADVEQGPVDLAMFRKLQTCASKWYRGEGDAEDGAQRYYKANMVERRAVALAFPGSIFVTFNGSEFRELFPHDMPIFYMYSIRRGVAVKPWFMTADAQAATAADTQALA